MEAVTHSMSRGRAHVPSLKQEGSEGALTTRITIARPPNLSARGLGFYFHISPLHKRSINVYLERRSNYGGPSLVSKPFQLGSGSRVRVFLLTFSNGWLYGDLISIANDKVLVRCIDYRS